MSHATVAANFDLVAEERKFQEAMKVTKLPTKPHTCSPHSTIGKDYNNFPCMLVVLTQSKYPRIVKTPRPTGKQAICQLDRKTVPSLKGHNYKDCWWYSCKWDPILYYFVMFIAVRGTKWYNVSGVKSEFAWTAAGFLRNIYAMRKHIRQCTFILKSRRDIM